MQTATTRVDRVEASFSWKIDGFSLLKADPDFSIRSPMFDVGGVSFRLVLFPAGEDNKVDESKRTVDVYLENESRDRVGFSIGMFVGGKLLQENTTDSPYDFADSTRWGWAFGSRDDLLREGDDVELRAHVTLIGKLSATPVVIGGGSTFRFSSLPSDWEKLLFNDKFSDVSLSVGGEMLAVHKLVLAARSPVFEAMFSSGMAESKSKEVALDGVLPSVAREFLSFLYTDDCSVCRAPPSEAKSKEAKHDEKKQSSKSKSAGATSAGESKAAAGAAAAEPASAGGAAMSRDTLAAHLLQLADRYQVPSLAEVCVGVLAQSLTTDNCAEVLILADRCHNDGLKTRCFEFVASESKRLAAVQATEGWDKLDASLLKEVVQALTPAGLRKRKAPEGSGAGSGSGSGSGSGPDSKRAKLS